MKHEYVHVAFDKDKVNKADEFCSKQLSTGVASRVSEQRYSRGELIVTVSVSFGTDSLFS